jgi:hypothetical protein
MASSEKNFLDYVQQHERTWGNQTYPNKPNLQQVLEANVVVFWLPIGSERNIKEAPQYTITLHDELRELEDYFAKLLFRAQIEPPKQRVAQIFAKGKRVRIKGVKIEFESA